MRSILTALAALCLCVGACSEDSSTSSDGHGTLTVRLSDAPFPFGDVDKVEVFVVRVDAKTSITTDNEAEDADDMTSWTTIAEPNAAFDLLDLQNGVTANLGSESLPTGTYKGFRLIIDPAQSSVTLKDGTKPSVVWPSASHTGIKINLDEDIAIDEDGSVMILDFDVGRSFVMRGNSISQNGLLFKPVIRAVATDVTGSVAGVVRQDTPTGPLMAGATVEILTAGSLLIDSDPDHIVASAVTDANGAFKIDFLLPGIYVVRVTPLAATTYLPTLLVGGLTLTESQDKTGVVIVVLKL